MTKPTCRQQYVHNLFMPREASLQKGAAAKAVARVDISTGSQQLPGSCRLAIDGRDKQGGAAWEEG